MNMLKSIVFFSVSVVYATCSHDVLFHRHRGKYLLNSVIRTVHAETESECGIYCSRDDACVSVNYKTTGKDRGLCELNHKTFTDASSNSAERKEFNYLEILRKEFTPPKSCKEILLKSPGIASGLYEILVDKQPVMVYCEMVLLGGGFTFVPKSAVKSGTLPNLVSQLFTSHDQVLLYIQKKDGNQTYTLIQQLREKSNIPLVVLQNTYSEGSTAYEIPRNSNMSDYLYLSTSRNINGFLSNNDKVNYSFAEGYPTRSYFAFFPNHRGQNVSMYHTHNLIFETLGVAVDWRNTGINVSGEKLPNQFFFLTEVHYGGAGCYTSSDRWVEGWRQMEQQLGYVKYSLTTLSDKKKLE